MRVTGKNMLETCYWPVGPCISTGASLTSPLLPVRGLDAKTDFSTRPHKGARAHGTHVLATLTSKPTQRTYTSSMVILMEHDRWQPGSGRPFRRPLHRSLVQHSDSWLATHLDAQAARPHGDRDSTVCRGGQLRARTASGPVMHGIQSTHP